MWGQGYGIFEYDINAFENCEISNFEMINSENHEFAPVLFGDGIAYVTEIKNSKSTNEEPYFDLKFTHFTKDIDIPFSQKIHSERHLGPLTFTSDQRTVYYTKNEESKRGKDGKFHMKMYRSYYSRREWKPLSPFRYNSDDYSVLHPTVSPNGKFLVFASNMPGGYGGYDLYICQASGRGWKKPVNLGANINTEKNEVFPFIYENHWLIYASDGREGYGGLDLYISDDLQSEWSYGENLGPVLNTSADDFSLVIDPTSTFGFYASSRKGGKGKDDIYKITFLSPIITRRESGPKEKEGEAINSEPIKIYKDLSIYIQDKETKQPIEDVQVSIDIETSDIKNNLTAKAPFGSYQTDEKGHLQVQLEEGHKYHIRMLKDGYSTGELTLDTVNFIPELILFIYPE